MIATGEIDRKAWKFFHRNAGWIVGEQAISAAHLARAEQWALEVGVVYEWVDDDTPCDGDCDCPNPRPSYEGCILYRDTKCQSCGNGEREHLASLWGICGATPEYRRVVEAELALEAMDGLHPAGNGGAL